MCIDKENYWREWTNRETSLKLSAVAFGTPQTETKFFWPSPLLICRNSAAARQGAWTAWLAFWNVSFFVLFCCFLETVMSSSLVPIFVFHSAHARFHIQLKFLFNALITWTCRSFPLHWDKHVAGEQAPSTERLNVSRSDQSLRTHTW